MDSRKYIKGVIYYDIKIKTVSAKRTQHNSDNKYAVAYVDRRERERLG